MLQAYLHKNTLAYIFFMIEVDRS